MPSRKKVILRKLTLEWLAGYLPPNDFAHDGNVELLDLSGKVLLVKLEELKWACFVRDFNSGEASNPERLLRKTFAGRPRSGGVWLRMQLKDNDSIEGLATNDLTLLDSEGIQFTPPDIRSNTQRIFVPRTSITSLQIIAVINSSPRKFAARLAAQESLFDPPA